MDLFIANLFFISIGIAIFLSILYKVVANAVKKGILDALKEWNNL